MENKAGGGGIPLPVEQNDVSLKGDANGNT